MSFPVNSHIHLLTAQCIPKKFFRSNVENIWYRFVKRLNLYNTYDKGNWLARRVNRGFYQSQKEIFDEFISVHEREPEMRFMAHSIDFDYADLEDPLISYSNQLHELILLKIEYQERLYPFLCIDPRRKQGEELVSFAAKYIRDRGFAGITLYPSLGFDPDTPALYPLYRYAEQMSIPIVTHLDIAGIFHDASRIELSSPEKFRNILAAHPKLKVCFTLLSTDGIAPGSAGWQRKRDRLASGLSFVRKKIREVTDLYLEILKRVVVSNASGVDFSFDTVKPKKHELNNKESKERIMQWSKVVLELLEKYKSTYVDSSAFQRTAISAQFHGRREMNGTDYFVRPKFRRWTHPLIPYEQSKPWAGKLRAEEQVRSIGAEPSSWAAQFLKININQTGEPESE